MFLIDKLFDRSKLSELVYSVYQQLDTVQYVEETIFDDEYSYGVYAFKLANGKIVTVDALNRIAIDNVRVYHRSVKHIYKRVKAIYKRAVHIKYVDDQTDKINKLEKLLNE